MTAYPSRDAASDRVAAPAVSLTAQAGTGHTALPGTVVTVVTGLVHWQDEADETVREERVVLAVFSDRDNAVRYMADQPGWRSCVAADHTLDVVEPNPATYPL